MTTTFKPEDTRPFNLEHARKRAPICMRNGEPVTILKWDMDNTFCIVGVVRNRDSEFVRTWYPDGLSGKNEEGDDPRDLVMLPNGYLDGRPVHVGDVLINGKSTPGFEYSFTVGPDMIDRFLNCKWPEPDDYEDEPETQPDTVILTKSDMAHVVWAYFQLAGSRFGLDSTVAHMTALREIAVKHGDLTEGREVPPQRLKAPAVPVVVDTSKAPPVPVPDNKGMTGWTVRRDEFSKLPDIEAMVFVELRNGYRSAEPLRAKSYNWKLGGGENDIIAFKFADADTFEDISSVNKGLIEDNIKQADKIRQLTEAKNHLETVSTRYIEDNAKLDKALDEQMSETGRWMAEAKKLIDEVDVLVAQRDGHKNRVDELNSRISMIAAYVRNDAAAVTFQNMSSYRAAVLSKVLD